jgi:hypothetical protein
MLERCGGRRRAAHETDRRPFTNAAGDLRQSLEELGPLLQIALALGDRCVLRAKRGDVLVLLFEEIGDGLRAILVLNLPELGIRQGQQLLGFCSRVAQRS